MENKCIDNKEIENKKIEIKEDKTGLNTCPICNRPTEIRIQNELIGDHIFRVNCDCERAEIEREESARKERAHNELVSRNKGQCFHEKRMWDWNFDSDDGSNPAMEKAKAFVENWDEIKRSRAGLLLWGGVGSGKSYMAACIANALIEEEKRVYMTDFATISSISTFDSDEYIQSINRFDLLIIDDLGAERKSEFAMQNVFNVINRRWESGKPLIITTNLTLKEMENMTSMQEQRIYDRIRDMCIPVLVDGPSRRVESADAKKELFKRIFGEER